MLLKIFKLLLLKNEFETFRVTYQNKKLWESIWLIGEQTYKSLFVTNVKLEKQLKDKHILQPINLWKIATTNWLRLELSTLHKNKNKNKINKKHFGFSKTFMWENALPKGVLSKKRFGCL